jgi:hypothetical protein
LATKGRPSARKARSTTGCRPPSIWKARLSSTTVARTSPPRRKIGKGRRQVDLGQRAGRGGDGAASRTALSGCRIVPLFDLQRMVARVQDPRLHLAQRSVVKRTWLAVVWRWMKAQGIARMRSSWVSSSR